MPSNILNVLADRRLSLEEAEFFPGEGLDFWHVTVIDEGGHVLGAGFGPSKVYARKVAISEYLERSEFKKIAGGDPFVRKKWGLDLIPTACGFAGGFSKQNTILRSALESAERWTMSKWIDEGFFIGELGAGSVLDLDPVSTFVMSQFEEVKFFKKQVLVKLGAISLKVEIAQTMAIFEGGIFPGSSAQATIGPIWQHALLESFRHLLFVRNNPVRLGRFPDDKIHFFAKNARTALDRISAAKKIDWPEPRVALHFSEEFWDGQFFLARTILGGWKSWNEGPIDRFLY
jgi:hypothetical protein